MEGMALSLWGERGALGYRNGEHPVDPLKEESHFRGGKSERKQRSVVTRKKKKKAGSFLARGKRA